MPTTVADFRRQALTLPNTIESSHMNNPDFRHVDARGTERIFATLAFQKKGCGVLKLTLDQQQSFIAELPAVFSPVHGGWGRMGMTLIHLAEADQSILQGALATAHRNLELKHATPKQNSNPAAKSSKPKPAKAKSPRRKA